MADPRHSEKRAVILAGATEVFRNEGYEGASMDRIADVAGVSKRTVYNHFGSKESLFAAVVELLIQQVAALKNIDWDPDRSLESQLRAFARAKTTVVDDPNWLALVRVVLAVAIKQPEFARQTMQNARTGEASLVRWLECADASGQMRVPNPEIAAQLFWAMISGALFWPQIFDPMPEPIREAAAGEIIETFLCRFRAPAD